MGVGRWPCLQQFLHTKRITAAGGLGDGLNKMIKTLFPLILVLSFFVFVSGFKENSQEKEDNSKLQQVSQDKSALRTIREAFPGKGENPNKPAKKKKRNGKGGKKRSNKSANKRRAKKRNSKGKAKKNTGGIMEHGRKRI